MRIVKIVALSLAVVLIIATIVLSILGNQERTGYIEILAKIDENLEQSSWTDTNVGWVNGVNEKEKIVLFANNNIKNKMIFDRAKFLQSGDKIVEVSSIADWGDLGVYLKTDESLEYFQHPNKIYVLDNDRKVLNDKKDENIYQVRIRYYSKVFRNNDIYGVYPKTDNLPEHIKLVKWDEAGSPFAYFSSTKELSVGDKIDNVGYTLKVKTRIIFIIILFVVFVALFVYIKHIKKICDVLLIFVPKLNYTKILDIALPAILGLGVFIVVFYNLKNAGWIFGDDHEPLRGTVLGKIQFMYDIRLGNGRFFPLGHFHWNLLLPFGNNPFAYYVVMNLFFITLVFFMYKLFLSITKKSYISFLLTILILLTPDIIPNLYYQMVFPESVLLPLIAIFIFCYKKGTETNKSVYFVISAFVCFYATYCKEPIFGIFLVFALTNLIFNHKELTKKQKYLLFFIILNAVVFVSLYAYLFRNTTGSYAEGRDGGIGKLGTFLYFFKNNYLFGFSILVAIFRGFCILFRKDRKLLTYDAYLFSGIAHVFAYVFMKLPTMYYIMPSFLPIFVAFAGYLHYIINIPKISENKEILYGVHILIVAVSIISFVNLFPKTLGGVKNLVSRRKETTVQTKLLLDLEDSGYKMYMVFPKDLIGYPAALRGWHYFVLHVFTSVEKHEKYNESYYTITKITDDEEIDLSENFLIYYGDENKFISNEMFNESPESYEGTWSLWGGRVYGKTNDIIQVDKILNEIRLSNK